MALLAHRQLDDAIGVEVFGCDRLHLTGDEGAVEPPAAALDQPPGLAVGRRQTGRFASIPRRARRSRNGSLSAAMS